MPRKDHHQSVPT